MKVSKRKWHYRWYNRWMNVWHAFGASPFAAAMTLVGRREHTKDYRPKSLCTYFWWCFLGAPTTLVILSLASLLIAAFLTVAIPVMWIKGKISEKKTARREKKGLHPKPEKGPSMLAVFVKTKKQKVCPRIELVD